MGYDMYMSLFSVSAITVTVLKFSKSKNILRTEEKNDKRKTGDDIICLFDFWNCI